jgi:hypothetical protein
MATRKSKVFLTGLTASLALFLWSLVDAGLRSRAAEAAIAGRAGLVAALDLTDLSLFTEARYTRHLTQADLHTSFQDHPLSLEHFPSGSLYPPPGILQQR